MADTALKVKKSGTDYKPAESKLPGYNKPTFAVLVGDSVKVYGTKEFGSLPHHDKFMVKERIKDNSGVVKARLVLKSSMAEKFVEYHSFAMSHSLAQVICLQSKIYQIKEHGTICLNEYEQNRCHVPLFGNFLL